MRIPLVAMNVEVGDHTPRDELALNELPRERDRFCPAQLPGKRELNLTGDLRVASFFAGL